MIEISCKMDNHAHYRNSLFLRCKNIHKAYKYIFTQI